MSLQNERQLLNTERKLNQLEDLLRDARAKPGPGRDSEVRSLARLVNELREEIVRYHATARVPEQKR
jgi:hypothetical protein